jgi:polyisoprenoid-binding protein YceI
MLKLKEHKMKTIILLFSTILSINSFASDYQITQGTVEMTGKASPGFLTINAKSTKKIPQGILRFNKETMSAEIEFDLTDLNDTKIEMRSQHMKEKYLQVDKFPTAKLKLSHLKLSEADLKKDHKNSFHGELTLHGVTKSISGDYSFDASSQSADVEFKLKMSDFNIETPRYKVVTVAEEVIVKTNIIIAKK